MNAPNELQSIRRRKSLDDWLANQRRRMKLRFPLIDFDSEHWPIRTLYKTDQVDWNFTKPLADFAGKDVSYGEALRCLAAEMVIAGKPKSLDYGVKPYRLLARVASDPLFDLTLHHLRQIETDGLNKARKNPASALRIGSFLGYLERKLLGQLAAIRVIPRLGFHVRAEVKAELRNLDITHRARLTSGQGDLLDRKMEAFNDAFNALVDNPLGRNGTPVLSTMDREAICAMTIMLCAPARINEPLCMSIDDHVTVDDYAVKSIGVEDVLHRAHQMLLMKGSKGADWSAKPVLLFMMDALNYCIDIVREQGRRSRMLVDWYQKNPTRLYLPPELEHLRGQVVTRHQLAQIIYMTPATPTAAKKGTANNYFDEIKDRVFKRAKPDLLTNEVKARGRRMIDCMLWADAEALLLRKVHDAMADCRRVTRDNHYQGDLSKMLFLLDRDEVPFLPYAIRYNMIRRCLKLSDSDRKMTRPPTLFQKLNITMPVGNRIQFAEMDSHDPRRWLTTMGLAHGERLSDVIINKWANRCNLAQLKKYDLRTAETRAVQAAMPEASKLAELTDLSNGLIALEKLEDRFGLDAAVVIAHDAGIAMTSMDAVTEAIENRPVARSSRGIIIVYPQRFGVCFHQHHERPCRNYSNDLEASCITCNEGAFAKGHIPTNDEIRKIATQLFGSVLRHLENLALSHNRTIADDPAMLAEHMLALAENGLDRATMVQFAVHLIDDFHQIKHLLKDRQLASRLEQAFVARGVVKALDAPSVANGALIKYHNPTQHAEPLLEIALDAHGGREQVARDELALIAKHLQFAPEALELTDERHLIAPDNDMEID